MKMQLAITARLASPNISFSKSACGPAAYAPEMLSSGNPPGGLPAERKE
jgi:hypothetical protein